MVPPLKRRRAGTRPYGKLRFLIVSGPTREPIDPVRFISNYSTGTMGKYLAEAAKHEKTAVTWVECPKDAGTARELLEKLKTLLPKHDVLIMAAAVCDVRPKTVSKSKIKKDRLSSITLVKNPDLLAALSKIKEKWQIFFGFGLESSDILKNGRNKLRKKSLELIVLQKVTIKHNPFGNKKIQATVLKKSGEIREFKSVSKRNLAHFLIREAIGLSRKISG